MDSVLSSCFLSLFDHLMPDLKPARCSCFKPRQNTKKKSTAEIRSSPFSPGFLLTDNWCSSVLYRSSLGCTRSSSQPTQPPAPHLHPAAAFLQPQRDCTVAHHRSDSVHPDTSTPTAPSHDGPLPANITVRPAAALHGSEHAQPVSVPLRSAHGRSICPHCPSQPGGSFKPSQRDGQRPLSLSPRPHPASCPASDQWTGSDGSSRGTGPAHNCWQSGRS